MQTSALKFTSQSKKKGSNSYLSGEIRRNCGSAKTCPFPTWQLRNKDIKACGWNFQAAELSLKWRTVVFTAARGLPELATTLEKLNCFNSEHRRGYQSKLLTDHSKSERLTVEVRFAEMTGHRHYSEQAHSPCKFSILLFGHFTKIKLVFKNTDSSFGVFFRWFACTV